MANWLHNQLTEQKKRSGMWSSLAEIMQAVITQYVDPLLSRISDRRSIFTMVEEDRETRIKELGSFFTIRAADASSIPMLLLQRLDEVHFKGTQRPVTQTFYREFNGVPISWQPLYAPIDIEKYPYGSILVTEETLRVIGDIFGEMFMTSRGVISISINDLSEIIANDETGELTQDKVTSEALTKFKQVVVPLLPLHIVFDGMQLLIYVNIDAEFRDACSLIEITDTVGTLHLEQEKAHIRECYQEITEQGTARPDSVFYYTHRFDDIPLDMYIEMDVKPQK